MGEPLILETSFLVDFERENNRGTPGPALTFLDPTKMRGTCPRPLPRGGHTRTGSYRGCGSLLRQYLARPCQQLSSAIWSS